MTNAAPDFHVSTTTVGSQTTVIVEGEVDLATAPLLRDRLDSVIDETTTDIAVDLSQVRFLDSTGLSVLVAAHQRSAESGHALHVVRASLFVRRVFRVSGLTQFLDGSQTALSTTED